jgi:preprotein translocase subunit SecD
MLEFSRWKYVLIAFVLLLSAFYSAPNLYPQDPAVQIAANRGGTIDAALTARVKALLDAAKVPYKSVEVEGKYVMARLASPELQVKAADQLRGAGELENYTVALNLASTVPSWFGKLGAKPMTLGLDLRGGVHFLMEVDQAQAREKRENAYVDEVRRTLRDNDVNYTTVARTPQGMRIVLRDAADGTKAKNLLARDVPRLVVADQPDGSILAALPPNEIQRIEDEAIEQNLVALRNRVATLAEPVIQRQGSSRIIVQMPGVQDVAEAKRLLGGTSTLEWRAVVEGNAMAASQPGGVVPPGARLYWRRPVAEGAPKIPILLSNRVIVSGDQLVDAIPGIDQASGQNDVSIRLDTAGGKHMRDHTLDNVGKLMAIVKIDTTPTMVKDPATGQMRPSTRVTEEVISAATIQGVFGANFHTTGLEPEEAQELSKQLKAGALAAPMTFVEERVVGPSLGAENVRRGIQAVLYSFVFVMVFFLIYYKMFGIITNLALLLNLLLVVAVMSVGDATLTLPGFAGIALTVGMSVDANVLINERIREELRLGLTPLASIAAGYDKASGTIADANVTALLGGLAMWAFGSGPIRGFGLTLVIGILTSMFTAVFVSRGIATFVYGRRRKLATISI